MKNIYLRLIEFSLWWLIIFICCLVVDGKEIRDPIPGDEQLTKAMIGVWKEIYHQDCLDGESIVIYYPDHSYEEFTTYIANEDCQFINTGNILKAGESGHEANTGTWKVSGGHIYYNETTGNTSSMRIVSINAKRASLTWDNGNTCESYRIDFQ